MTLCHQPPCGPTQVVLTIRKKRKMPKCLHPVLDSLGLSSQIHIIVSFSEHVSLLPHLYNVGGLCSESLLPAFLSRAPGSSHTALSWCIVQAASPWHSTEIWRILCLFCIRCMQNPFWENKFSLKFSITFSLTRREARSALSHTWTLGLGLVALQCAST